MEYTISSKLQGYITEMREVYMKNEDKFFKYHIYDAFDNITHDIFGLDYELSDPRLDKDAFNACVDIYITDMKRGKALLFTKTYVGPRMMANGFSASDPLVRMDTLLTLTTLELENLKIK